MANNQILPALRAKKQHIMTYRPQYIMRNDDDPGDEQQAPSMNFLAMGIKLKTKSQITNKTKKAKNYDSENSKMPKLNRSYSNSNIVLLESLGVSYQLENKSANLILNNNDNLKNNQYKKIHYDRKSYMNVTGTNLKNIKFNQKILNLTKNDSMNEKGKAKHIVLDCDCEHDLNNHFEKHDCVSCKYKGKIDLNIKELVKYKEKTPRSANSTSYEYNNNQRAKTSTSKHSSENFYPFPNLQSKFAGNEKNLSRLTDRKNSENSRSETIDNNKVNDQSNEEEIIPKLTLWLV